MGQDMSAAISSLQLRDAGLVQGWRVPDGVVQVGGRVERVELEEEVPQPHPLRNQHAGRVWERSASMQASPALL